MSERRGQSKKKSKKKIKRNKGRNRWITIFFPLLWKLSCVNRSHGRNFERKFPFKWALASRGDTLKSCERGTNKSLRFGAAVDTWWVIKRWLLLPKILRCSLIIQKTMLLERPYNQHVQKPSHRNLVCPQKDALVALDLLFSFRERNVWGL